MKNQIIKSILMTSFSILTTQVAFANAPAKYPTCAKNIKIKEVKNGAGVYFDENCDVAYVLPPALGKIEINGLAPNLNLKLCGAYESTLNSLTAQYAHLEKLSQTLNQTSPVNPNEHSIDSDTSIDGTGSQSNAAATPVSIEPKIIEEYQKTLSLINVTKQSMAMFEDDKKGVAVGSIRYLLDWGSLLEQYRKANPTIHFERLTLEAGRIVFSRKLGVAGEVVTGAVAHTIQGIENTSDISANGTLSGGSGSVIMGDAISGQVVLNYAGACPFVKNGILPKTIDGSSLDAYISANFQYKYSLQGLRRYKASYNLASIAKHISESKTSGGFLSTKTVNSLTEANSSNDEFNMVIESDQASFEFDSSLRAEVKTELIGRVMREMAGITGQPVIVPSLTPPPAHGAVATADALQKCPNLYCQIGAVGVRLLDAVFGNSTAVAQYIKEKNGVSVDNVTEKRMFTYLGSMTFTGVK